MSPIFGDQASRRSPQTIAMKVLFIAIAAIMAAAVAMMFDPPSDTPMLQGVFIVAMLAIMGSALTLIVTRISRVNEPKAKRDSLDLYSVIDRLVADVDDDEAAYLRRRLDEREDKAKNDLTLSLDELLEQRAEARRTREQ